MLAASRGGASSLSEPAARSRAWSRPRWLPGLRSAGRQTDRRLLGLPLLEGIKARLLRPPFWAVKLISRLPLFRLNKVLLFVETPDRVVALTLDDGPDAELTPRVLVKLKDHGAKATFFLLGEAADRNAGTVKEIVSQGHEIGNHTWQDESSAGLPECVFRDRLSRTHEVLIRAGPTPRLFRPGGGWLGWRGQVVTIAKDEHDYRCVLGSVYPHDVRASSVGFIAADVLKRVRPGAIIVLHEGEGKPEQPPRQRIVEILEHVLQELSTRNYRVVTVSELITAEGRSRRS
jgi:peptidoglycan/xylan/chitin deacetylase (PgdA/CDA1 family)